MFHLVKRNAVKNQKSYRRCHLLADEIVKQDLPLVFPGVRCQGKSIKGADVYINFRPKAKTVRLKVSTKSATIKQAQQTNKPNKHEKIKKTKIIISIGGNLVMISTLESSMGAGAEMEACLACWFGFVSCQGEITQILSETDAKRPSLPFQTSKLPCGGASVRAGTRKASRST